MTIGLSWERHRVHEMKAMRPLMFAEGNSALVCPVLFDYSGCLTSLSRVMKPRLRAVMTA